MSYQRCMYHEPGKKRCKNIKQISIRVSVFHPITERRSKQIWDLCEKHLILFLQTKGCNWSRWKTKNGIRKICIAVEYEILEDI